MEFSHATVDLKVPHPHRIDRRFGRNLTIDEPGRQRDKDDDDDVKSYAAAASALTLWPQSVEWTARTEIASMKLFFSRGFSSLANMYAVCWY